MHGIIVVQLRRSCGFIMKSWDFKRTNGKKLFLVPIYEARRASLIVIEDARGNLVKQELDGAF